MLICHVRVKVLNYFLVVCWCLNCIPQFSSIAIREVTLVTLSGIIFLFMSCDLPFDAVFSRSFFCYFSLISTVLAINCLFSLFSLTFQKSCSLLFITTSLLLQMITDPSSLLLNACWITYFYFLHPNKACVLISNLQDFLSFPSSQ